MLAQHSLPLYPRRITYPNPSLPLKRPNFVVDDMSSCDTLSYSLEAASGLSSGDVNWYLATKYGFFVILGAWFWDVVMVIGEELTMLKKHLFSVPNVVYILSRALTFGTVLSAIIFISRSDINCVNAFRALAWMGAFALPTNAALFLLRVNGVFGHSRLATFSFVFLWLSTFASLTLPFGARPINIDHSLFCTIGSSDRYGGAGFITLTIFDTIVFVSITLRILSFTAKTTWRAWLYAFISGRGIGHVSRAILQTGQLYYLATCCVNIASTIVTFGAFGPPQFQGVVLVLNVALQNAMACKVYRILRLNLALGDSSRSTAMSSTLNFAGTPIQSDPFGWSETQKQSNTTLDGRYIVFSSIKSQETNVVVDSQSCSSTEEQTDFTVV
ncbi:hypothetical protein QCA50_004277 [Cerrena zonata]|uniref:Transmembrane protein n=1 Tax=Cerrena zonata TaxID=2478898 RepID=A0AAW0GNI5_9APHY